LATPATGWLLAIFMALCGSVTNGASFYADAPFYALQLAFLLIAASNLNSRELALIAVVYAGVIISIFCKLSFAVSAGPIILCAAFLLARKFVHTPRHAALSLMGVVGIPVIIWLGSGQSLLCLFDYIVGPNLSIVLGYSSAMAVDDPAAAWQVPAFWLGAVTVALLIFRAASFRLKSSFCSVLVALCSLFLFWTTFKAGMVRHDGHAQIAGLSMACFAVLAIAYMIKTNTGDAQFIMAVGPLALGLSISAQYFPPVRSHLGGWINQELGNAYLFAKTLVSGKARQKIGQIRQDGFKVARKNAENLGLIPKGSDVDSLPWDITDIPAGGLRYRPRPIIQSYSAYTHSLQELNRSFFLGQQAPAYLVLSAQSIDGRISPDLDSPSLDVIASRYEFVGTGSKGSLILKRHNGRAALPGIRKWREMRFDLPGDEVQDGNPSQERWIQLPRQLAQGSRFSLELKPSIWRRLQAIAFKAPPLMIAVKFDDGQILTYRVFEAVSRKIPLYPFVDGNKRLKSFLMTLHDSPISKQDLGPKPVAIRLLGAMSSQGLDSGELIIEQP
jgi:hypothetical protein